LTWFEGISHGGADVIDYNVYYDQAIDDFVLLQAGVTVKEY
jgi:hypothetical protein